MVVEYNLGMPVGVSAVEERSKGKKGRRQGRLLGKEKDP
jgi:hypothetical protein